MIESAGIDPPKMQIANVDLGTSIDAQFNPTEVSEELSALYSRLQVLGLSHQPLQYQGTSNHGFSFELAFRALGKKGENLTADVMARRNFILSMFYPSKQGNGSPPRALLIWPGLAALTCKLLTYKGKHTFFNKKAYPMYFAIELTIEETRDVRIYSEDILANGTIRPATSLTGSQSAALNA